MKSMTLSCSVAAIVLAIAGLAMLPVGNADAGAAAFLTCEGLGGGSYVCDAFPGGQGFSYSWTRTGNVALNAAPPSSNVRQLSCFGGGNGGTVFVTVTHPNGTTGTASQFLPCSGGFPF